MLGLKLIAASALTYVSWYKLLPVDRYSFCKENNKKPFVKGEDRSPDSMIFIHGTDNNLLNYGAKFLKVYQEEYKCESSTKR